MNAEKRLTKLAQKVSKKNLGFSIGETRKINIEKNSNGLYYAIAGYTDYGFSFGDDPKEVERRLREAGNRL
jgi:hypothetical protein